MFDSLLTHKVWDVTEHRPSCNPEYSHAHSDVGPGDFSEHLYVRTEVDSFIEHGRACITFHKANTYSRKDENGV
jgi:hypothetical protein